MISSICLNVSIASGKLGNRAISWLPRNYDDCSLQCSEKGYSVQLS